MWALYLLYFLAVVFAVIQGWLEQNDEVLIIGGYPVAILFTICVFVMAYYALGYVWQLWKEGHRKEAIQGLIMFVFLNILTGYIWFYWSEIKQQEIRFKLV